MLIRYVVTGGAGFIGTNFVKYVKDRVSEVVVIDDLSAGKRDQLPEGVVFHQLDIRDTEALIKVLQRNDTIVHLAARPRVQDSIDDPQASHDVNVNGTLSVLEAARAKGARRIVFAASSAVYGDQPACAGREILPLAESLPAQPKSPYALHKYIGEQYLQLWSELYDIETVSLRFFNVYGPHLDPEGPYALVIGRFLKFAAAGEPLPIVGDGEQTRDFIHVHDVARAIERAIVSTKVGKGEVCNIGAGKQTTINELAQMIGGAVEYLPPRIEPRHTLADLTRVKALLDWEPEVDLEKGIAELKSEWKL